MKLTRNYLKRIIQESVREELEGEQDPLQDYPHSEEELIALGKDLTNAMEQLERAGGPNGDPQQVAEATALIAVAAQKHFKGSGEPDMQLYSEIMQSAIHAFGRHSSKSKLRRTGKVNEMFGLSQGVSDVVTGNFIYDGLQVVGVLLATLLGAGVVKGIEIKRDLERKAAEKVIEQRKADAAARVVELVEKYKDNAELMDLLKAKKMKLFSQKLSELEKGSSGRGIGPGLGSDVYRASKKRAGI